MSIMYFKLAKMFKVLIQYNCHTNSFGSCVCVCAVQCEISVI
jgi:hypothetical protein